MAGLRLEEERMAVVESTSRRPRLFLSRMPKQSKAKQSKAKQSKAICGGRGKGRVKDRRRVV